MGKKLKLGILALVGVLGLAAFAPTAKADEDRWGGGNRGEHGDRGEGGNRYRDDWRRDRFEHRHWGWNRGWRPYYRVSPYYYNYR